MKRVRPALWTAVAAVVGCHASVDVGSRPQTTRTEVVTTTTDDPARAHETSLDELAADVRNASDPLAEGSALRRLRSYTVDHRLTYTIATFRLSDNTAVVAPSARTFSVRTDVSFFRQQQPVYSFSFIPKDNKNLTIIAADQ